MSQENVEVVGRMYDAFERGDYETSLSYLDPEIEFSQPAQEPGGGMYHGHDGVMQAFAKWLGPSRSVKSSWDTDKPARTLKS